MILPQSGIIFYFGYAHFWIRLGLGYVLDTIWIRFGYGGIILDTLWIRALWIRFGYVLGTFWIRLGLGYVLDTF